MTDKIYPLLVESLDHMKLSPSKKEFARAVLRLAIEYACARQAGFVFKPNPPDEKPLFIPLKTQWFRAFESGAKSIEYRAYGPRWNEKTCRPGRNATVSHGYSGARLHRVVTGFEKLHYAIAPPAAKEIYPNAEWIAAIEMGPALITL
jgi:hypothetical protein